MEKDRQILYDQGGKESDERRETSGGLIHSQDRQFSHAASLITQTERKRRVRHTDTELYLPRTLEPAALWEMHLRVIWPDGNRRRDK